MVETAEAETAEPEITALESDASDVEPEIEPVDAASDAAEDANVGDKAEPLTTADDTADTPETETES